MSDTDLMLRAQSHLQNLIRRAQDLTSSESFDETREGDDDPLDDSLQECLSDLLDYVQLLGELHPSIEAHIPLLEDAPGLTPDEAADRAAHLLFSDMIRSKFSAAPDTLVDLLGRLNLDRFTRLAESREKNQKNEFEIPETASIELKSSSFLDSGLGSSLPPGSSQAPPSMSVPSLHLSGMTDSLPGAPSRVTSSIVASSLAFTVAGNSRSKLPRMPANSPTKPFNCHYCAKKVSFSTKRDWQ